MSLRIPPLLKRNEISGNFGHLGPSSFGGFLGGTGGGDVLADFGATKSAVFRYASSCTRKKLGQRFGDDFCVSEVQPD
jgi:hypothetical protein